MPAILRDLVKKGDYSLAQAQNLVMKNEVHNISTALMLARFPPYCFILSNARAFSSYNSQVAYTL